MLEKSSKFGAKTYYVQDNLHKMELNITIVILQRKIFNKSSKFGAKT